VEGNVLDNAVFRLLIASGHVADFCAYQPSDFRDLTMTKNNKQQ